MNNLLLGIACFFVVVFTALFAVPPMIDWNDFRGTFEEEASRLLDREVRVRGNVNVRLLPIPYVSFEKVRIADAPGNPGSLARAESFRMWLAVPPLLRGAFEARQIELVEPVIRLRTEPDGSGNWRRLRLKGELAYLPKEVALSAVKIVDGTLLFESYQGHEIAKLAAINGDMSAASLEGPYKFIGTLPIDGLVHEARLSTTQMDATGRVRFNGSVRGANNALVHTIDGTVSDILGKVRAEGRLVSRVQTGQRASPNGERTRRDTGYEFNADVKLDADALRLDDIAISFLDKDRQQTMKGSAVASWIDGVATETRLSAPWLDLDAIAGAGKGESPRQVIERLLAGGFEPFGAGVTSLFITIDQATLAGTAISDLSGHMVRRGEVTKIEAMRAALPGRSAVAIEGFAERRNNITQFDGSVVANSASFAELAEWLRLDLSPEAKLSLTTSFMLDGKVRIRPKSLHLTDARIALATAVAEGDVAYQWAERPALSLDIDANAIDLSGFGDDFLAPERFMSLLGIDAGTGTKPPAWLQGTDLTLKLRADRLSDGRRHYSKFAADLGRAGDVLTLTTLKGVWEPGLRIDLTGRLENLSTSPTGALSGLVAAANGDAGRRLADTLSLAARGALLSDAIASRVPLRLAVDARFSETNPKVELIADGSMGPDRVRIELRSHGVPGAAGTAGAAGTGWMGAAGDVQVQVSGDDAVATLRRVLGAPALSGRTATVPAHTDAASGGSPQTAIVVMRATGVPKDGMKTFVKVAAGDVLTSDFAGDLEVRSNGPAFSTQWRGELDIRRSSARALAQLSLPAFAAHAPNSTVRGRVALSGTADGLRIVPKRVAFGGATVTGDLRWQSGRGETPAKLAGALTVSKAPLTALLGLLSKPNATDRPSGEDGIEGAWPSVPFDFAHLAGFTSALELGVPSLLVGAREIKNARLTLETSPSAALVKAFSGRYGGATYSGSADFQKSQAGVTMTARLKGAGLELARFAPSIARRGRLAGKADVALTVAGQGLSPRSMSTVLSGEGTIKLNNVTIPGITSAAVTDIARRVIDGVVEIDQLSPVLGERMAQGKIVIGGPLLKVRVTNGTVSLPTIQFDLDEGGLSNATVADLARWEMESRWTITPASQPKPDAPEQKVALPSVSLIYGGSLSNLETIEPRLDLGDLERELVVRKMEANVARLERLRREDEERAAAERERRRQIEEEQRRSLEDEAARRSPQAQPQSPTGGAAATAPVPIPVRPPTPAAPGPRSETSTPANAALATIPQSAPAAPASVESATPAALEPTPARRPVRRQPQRPAFQPFINSN